MERNRISSLQSHGKELEKECCLPGVFCDVCVYCEMCVLANLEYLSIWFCAVFWAAAPGLVAVLSISDSAYVSGTVTPQAIGFPLAHGRRVVPSGRLLSSRIRLIGSFIIITDLCEAD